MKLVNYIASSDPKIVKLQIVDAVLPVFRVGTSDEPGEASITNIVGSSSVIIGGTTYTSAADGVFSIPAIAFVGIGPGIIFESMVLPELYPIPEVHIKYISLINSRNMLLANTDWAVVRHRDQTDFNQALTLTAEEYSELLAYRQALRDFPETADLNNIVWPTPPSFL